MAVGFTYHDFFRSPAGIAHTRRAKGLPFSQMTGLPMLAVPHLHIYSLRRPAMYATAQTMIGLRHIVEIGDVGQVIRRRSASDIGIASVPSQVPRTGFQCPQ